MSDSPTSRPHSLVARGWRARVLTEEFLGVDWSSWLTNLVDQPDSLPGYRLLKQGGDTNVLLTDLRPGFTVVVKHSRRGGILARLDGLFRHSAEAREFAMAADLRVAGIRTPEPLALLDRPGNACHSVLVTKYVENLRDLDQVVMAELPRRKGSELARLKRGLAEELARLVAAFHRAGFHHRDLKASNILVQLPADAEAAPTVWLVDLKGVSRSTSTNAGRQLRALTRLAASLLGYRSLTRADYARFLATYVQEMGSKRQEWWKIYPTISRDAHKYNVVGKSRKRGKIDAYGGG